VIVGAGLSGIGAACHLQAECPGKRFVILEAPPRRWDVGPVPLPRRALGLGHVHARLLVPPWREAKAIADAPRSFATSGRPPTSTGSTAASATTAGWCVPPGRHPTPVGPSRWRTPSPASSSASRADFSTEYRLLPLDEGYSRASRALGLRWRIVHPSTGRPTRVEDRSVVVIGSGATAVTLVPALAARASHVTMLQRSPSYVMSLPEHDGIADLLRHLLPERLAYPLVR